MREPVGPPYVLYGTRPRFMASRVCSRGNCILLVFCLPFINDNTFSKALCVFITLSFHKKWNLK